MFGTCDYVCLQICIHIVEIIAVTGNTYQQVAIFLRMFLCIVERFGIDDVKLDMMSAQCEVRTNQSTELVDVLFRLQQTRHETLVQQRTAALLLIQFTQRLDHCGWSVSVGSVFR